MPTESSSDKLALRAVTRADADFLYQLYASTRADEMALVDWSEQQKQDFLQMQFDAQSKYYHEQYTDANFDIIELEGRPIGRLYVDQREDEISVIDIALLPQHRGCGIGGHYMREILDQASGRNCVVSIHVEHNNPAMHLYQRLGFEKIKDTGVYWLMQWRKTPGQEKTAS